MKFLQKTIFIFFLSIVGFLIVFKMAIYTVRETLELVVVIEKKEIKKFENLKDDKIKQIPISFYFEKKKLLDR
mgnify:CR=1 FL=1